MTVDERRAAAVREVAKSAGVDPQLLLELIALEREHTNLHAYGARTRLRRAAERLIDAAHGRGPGAEES